MRVIAGQFKGRTLHTPPGRGVRPTQGHVRQVLFDLLREEVIECRVLDLFSGSGAIGIEALSRGASEACFVERNHAALRCLRWNIEELGLTDRSRVLAASVGAALRILEESGVCYDWIFSDPPYRSKPEQWMLKAERSGPGGLLEAAGTLVLESSCRQTVAEQVGRLRRYRSHRVGETCLEFYGWDGRSDEADGNLPGDV